MKFGRNLPRNQVPEWASSYINYKGLKKLIKTTADNSQESGESDLAGFLHALDRSLEDVDHFYNKKYQDFARRLSLLENRYGSSSEAAQELEPEDHEDLLAALLELRGSLRKLQWYGEVNRRGFIKITKKLDKKIATANAQQKYLALKVDPSAFATNAELFVLLKKTNDWISLLGETAPPTSEAGPASIPQPPPLKRTTSQQALKIPPEAWALVEQQIREDDAKPLATTLEGVRKQLPDVPETVYQQFLRVLLQRSISSRSRNCVALLLRQIVFLDDSDDINGRNCLHRLVVSIGRAQDSKDQELKASNIPDAESELYSFITPAAAPSTPFRPPVTLEEFQNKTLSKADDSIAFLLFVLDNLQPAQRSALRSRDNAGRTPLHFAAEYGVKVLCEVIVEHLQRWKMFAIDKGIDASEWQDNEGWSPLHLAAIGGHPLTTKALLDAEQWSTVKGKPPPLRRYSPQTAASLALATKTNFIEVVRILVQAGVDLNHQDEQGETALHVAARFGHTECAQILLAGSDVQTANTELAEIYFGWTPLFIACVDGHVSVVDLLIEAGAELDKPDTSGWTPKEHAALRGHMVIAKRLAKVTSSPSSVSPFSSSPPDSSSITDRKSNGLGNGISAAGSTTTIRVGESVKTFGHRYLTDKSMILVSLGTMDTRKPQQAVSLDRIPLVNAHSTQLDTALSIVVSAKQATGESEVIDLPVHDNISTEPIVFHAADPSKVKILFDLVPTYAGNHERIVGRGVAMLANLKHSLGSKKMPLQGDVTIPLVAAGDLEVIGSLTFNFLVINPFTHPKMKIDETHTYWKSVASTMVIGHRGLGKNMAGMRSLQLGENTIQSFIAAANLGASYVEFDVQLTKDHVPVIYHDFFVSETGIDAPVHTLTLEQFLHVNDSRTPKQSRPGSPTIPTVENLALSQLKNGAERPARQRSYSVGPGSSKHEPSPMDERMKHTRDFKKKGFKGNSRGNQIAAPFATLKEMFEKLPAHVGFNIEMKYPMLFESEDEEMDQYAVELNSFVDTVLTTVYDLAHGRNVIFSSFNPDICLLLSFKQPSIPVLFLTDAGVGAAPVGDVRASSLQEAVRFASRWNLLGIVSAADPFTIAPRLVRVVKESGLVCVSYGVLNNENDKVRLQVEQGIDAVIVDSVLAIRKGLTGSTPPPPTVSSWSTSSADTAATSLSSGGLSQASSVSLPEEGKLGPPTDVPTVTTTAAADDNFKAIHSGEA